MRSIISCEQCDNAAMYTVQAVAVAGEPYQGAVHYLCADHYNEFMEDK
jgi:hypothetical protein